MGDPHHLIRLAPGVAPKALRLLLWSLLTLLALLFACVVIFRWDQIGTLSDPRWQTILTVIGLAVGAWFAGIMARAEGRFRKTARISLVALLVSQVCFLLLVWTSLKMNPAIWRVWWLTMVAATVSTHVLWLRLTAAPDRRGLSRTAVACALFVAAMLATLALRRNILDGPFTGFAWVVIPPALFSIAASAVLWLRGVRLFREGVPKAVVVGWRLASAVFLLVLGFYAGRLTAPGPSLFGTTSSPLAQMSAVEVAEQLDADVKRLRIISAGLDELEARVAKASVARARLSPADQDRVRSEFMSYLAYRDALLRMSAMYAGHETVRDPSLRARCVLVGQAAGSLVFEHSLKLVNWYGGDAAVRSLLNEPDARWGIPAGMFDRIHENVANPANVEALAELGAYIEANREHWAKDELVAADELAWLTGQIAQSTATSKVHQLDPIGARWDQAVARIRRQAYTPLYATQSFVSTWVGDTRLVQWEPLITTAQIKQMQAKLQPGDVLLERRNWFLSNAFLPGFWPHSAVYIGTPEELVELGLIRRDGGRYVAIDERLKPWLAAYLKPAHDGEAHTVIEAVSEGVIFNSLTESMHADYVAVLRPRVSAKQKAEAIARCFEHIGKPYDFEFDISTTDKLVCSELVYLAYADALKLEACLQKVMGREALPPLELARKFAQERGSDEREFDFVLFLDGVASRRAAVLADEDAFASSIYRPKGYSE